VLEQNGVEVLMTRVPATSSIKERAQMLEEAISEKYGGRQVNLVGHSMVCLHSLPVAFADSCREVSIADT
jgi:triacylglycerol esterase/lipase EstA (alpha/beta hydrolase family)